MAPMTDEQGVGDRLHGAGDRRAGAGDRLHGADDWRAGCALAPDLFRFSAPRALWPLRVLECLRE
jgi:hypothetical protein